jgi:hypothetical protein
MRNHNYFRDEFTSAARYVALVGTVALTALGAQEIDKAVATSPKVAIEETEAESIKPLIIAAAPDKEELPPFAIKNSKKCGWIADKPSGYYIGTTCEGDIFVKLNQSESGAYEFGVIKRKGRQICGWIERDLIREREPRKDYERCSEYFEERENRYNIGKDFNCPDGKCVDGATMELSEDCDNRLYRNYASSSPSPTNLKPNNNSGFYDYVGVVMGSVRYRFTKRRSSRKDGPAIVVGTDEYGWGYMSADCRNGLPRGGAVKHDKTVPGPNPNTGIR